MPYARAQAILIGARGNLLNYVADCCAIVEIIGSRP